MSTKKANERFSLLLKQKTIPWDEVVTMLTINNKNNNKKSDDTILVSSCRQALARACLDRSVSHRAMKLLLQKTSSSSSSSTGGETNNTMEDRVKLIIKAVRCQNRTATKHLIQYDDNFAILYWRDIYRYNNSLLHMLCARDGWNDEIAYVLRATLSEQDVSANGSNSSSSTTTTTTTTTTTLVRSHAGMFERNAKGKTPLRLSLEAGADFHEIIDYLKSEHKESFEKHLAQHLPELIAEYCDEMSMLQDLIDEYPTLLLLHPTSKSTTTTTTTSSSSSSSLLHYACYYQNQEMIRLLLDLYTRRGERRRKLWNRLTNNNNNSNSNNNNININSSSNDKDYMMMMMMVPLSPLGYLILGLGSMDAGNAFECVQICMNKIRNLPILHYTIDKLWDRLVLLEGKQQQQHKHKQQPMLCLRTITRIVERFNVDLTSLDHGKRSVLVLLILKLTTTTRTTTRRTATNQEITTTITRKREEDINANNNNDGLESSSSKEKSKMDCCPEMFLEYVLSKCPRAAHQKDGKKRLPLHVACENGLQWHDGGGLRQLVNANVSGLEVIDPKSGLLPFALAATCPYATLTTIYELLRYNPGVMMSII